MIALSHSLTDCPLDRSRSCHSCSAIFSPLLMVCPSCGSSDHGTLPICGEAVVEARTKIMSGSKPTQIICRVRLREGYSLLVSANKNIEIGGHVRLQIQSDGRLSIGDLIQ